MNPKIIGPIFLIVAMLLTSCQRPQPTESNNNVLMLSIGSNPKNLNPILVTDYGTSKVVDKLFRSLFIMDQTMEMQPDLVDTYTVSKDGKRYVFKLKNNIAWHDGHPVDAEDVVFTFNTILDPKTNTVRRSNYIIDGRPVIFNVVDSHTVEAILPKPFAPFLVSMGMEILPQHLLKNQNINTTSYNIMPIGNGRFAFEEWKTDQYIRLKAVDSYSDKPAKIDGIIYRIIPDQNTGMLALKNGEIDASGVPYKDVASVRDDRYFQLFEYETPSVTYMGYNLTHPILGDKRVRHAIAHAINKDALIKGVLNGFGTPAEIPDSPVSWSYPDSKDIPTFNYDPNKAMALLDAAGWRMNPKTKQREKDGRPLTFTCITNKGNTYRDKAAQVIRQYLLQVGITMDIQLMEWQSFISLLHTSTTPKPVDAFISGWALGADPDGTELWHSDRYPKGLNYTGYSNKRVDQWLSDGRQTLDRDGRRAIYQKINAQIAEDQPYLFLYHPISVAAVNPRVKGIGMPGPAGLFLNIENITLN